LVLVLTYVNAQHGRVIGGQPVKLGEYSHLVYIVADSGLPTNFACTGSMLNRRYVLTAGHCIASTLFVIYGLLDVNGFHTSDVAQVQRWMRHPKYDEKTKIYDIALLELAIDIPENAPYVSYVSVALNFPPYGYPLQIAGWGLTEGNQGTTTPRYGTVHIGPDSACNFVNYNTQYWFCISDKDTLACPGDSGSAVVVRNADRWAVIGIDSVTGSTDCANVRSPTAETKVANMVDFLVANTPLEPIQFVTLSYNSSLVSANSTLTPIPKTSSASALENALVLCLVLIEALLVAM
jgi:secreted trypsin-like serine protease